MVSNLLQNKIEISKLTMTKMITKNLKIDNIDNENIRSHEKLA